MLAVTLPRIDVEKAALTDFDRAISLEWIVTNRIGGYASSSVLGINTRKYHGILVAAFNPPVDRRVLLAKLDEEIQWENTKYSVGSNEFEGTIYPEGYRFLHRFSLAPFPTYEYLLDQVQLKKEIFMPYQKNATVVYYELINPFETNLLLRISPLVNFRHFHDTLHKDALDSSFIQKSADEAVIINLSNSPSTLILSTTEGRYIDNESTWIQKLRYRVDASRGESYLDDCYKPGYFEIPIEPHEKKTFYLTANGGRTEDEARNSNYSIQKKQGELSTVYRHELERQKELIRTYHARYNKLELQSWMKWLILTADSLLVRRRTTNTRSVIAGYHWFEDWGRDSLISLPGLTLVTGRFQDAREILLTFTKYCNEGLIPNRFPDKTGDAPIYNSVDATLWFFTSVLQYLKYTQDFSFVHEELWDVLQLIMEHLNRGTLYDIHVESDGLLAHGPQVTWMDAALNDRFITPREGKAVEIQALWYNSLKTMQLLSSHFTQPDDAMRYSVMAEKLRETFVNQFWDRTRGFLRDVTRRDAGDSSLRPNQIIAAALDFPLLDRAKATAVVEVVWKELWTEYGLRTLSVNDPRYLGSYSGDWSQRTTAYHNGTVWPWLLGPFATAFLKTRNYDERWRRFVFQEFYQPFFTHAIHNAGLGAISEIFDGDPPHNPRGCISQAWSLAEPLRAYVEDVVHIRPPYEQLVLNDIQR